MILLNTGALSANAPQINADKCLGGYPSSTGVPNGRLNNLFPNISKSDVLQKKSVIRMIALKNTTGAAIPLVKIYTQSGTGHVKMKIAAVASALDSNNNPVFESVFDGYSLPYQAELNYHEGVVNAIEVENLAANQIIGIWILREIDLSKFDYLTTDATGPDLAKILEEAEQISEDDISLTIDY